MKIPVNPTSKPSAAAPTERHQKNQQSPALTKSCQDFESLFLHSLFKGMRSTGVDGGILEKGRDQEIFEDLLDTEVANAAAAQNTLGIAKSLLRQFGEQKK